MKKILILLSLTLVLMGCSQTKSANENAVSVGILQYSQHPALDKTYEGFKKALSDNGFSEDDNIVFNFNNAQSDSATNETIADKLVNDKHDLIFAIATPSAQAVAQKTQDIPVVIAAVTDPQNAGLVESNELPGGNITGVSDLTAVKEQIDLLHTLIPDAESVAVLYASSEDNSRLQANMAKEAIENLGMKALDASVSEINEIEQVTQSLVGKVDAIYIPTDNLLAEGMSTVSMITMAKEIPVIVGEKGMTEAGGLASDALDYFNHGYMAGLQAAQILKGEALPKDMPIGYLEDEHRELVINEDVAEALNIMIPEDLKAKATFVKWNQ